MPFVSILPHPHKIANLVRFMHLRRLPDHLLQNIVLTLYSLQAIII